MSIRLGQMLVNGGKITARELDEALKSQVIFGGRLGTNLIELGYIEEQELADFLSRKLGVQCATPDQLDDIPAEVIAIIPREVAERYKVIPVSIEKKRLTLALADPSDLQTIDEIAFQTGYVIIPLVTPELRLVMLQERYYGITRETRYFKVPGMSRQRLRERNDTTAKSATENAFSRDKDAPEFPSLDDFQGFHKDDFPVASTPVDHVQFPESVHRYTIDRVSVALASAADRDAIATALVSYLGQEFPCAALFLVRVDEAVGWQGTNEGHLLDGFEQCHISLEEPSLIQTVSTSKSLYLGPIPNSPGNSQLVSAIGGNVPSGILLLPIQLGGRIVAILCVAGVLDDLTVRLRELQKLALKSSFAFEILILRNKIMVT